MNILVLVPANDEHKATLETAAPEASFTYTSPDAAADEEVAAAASARRRACASSS